MPRLSLYAGILAMAACVALTACSGSTASPTTPATPSNISGDYSGTMVDAQGGTGTATGTLAQHGFTAGGTFTDTESSATLNAQISLTLTASNATSGAMVIDYAGGATCTFSTTGNYNPTTNVLSGSYSAVTNCSGDSGTYSLTQQCTATVTSDKRRFGGIAAC
jgi:hypothetical protein